MRCNANIIYYITVKNFYFSRLLEATAFDLSMLITKEYELSRSRKKKVKIRK